jgi:predicted  nucleic acid-binding Zn-ribbon protein
MWENLFLLQEVEIKIQIDLKEKKEIDEKIYLEDGKKAKESLLSKIKNAITKYQLQINKIESKIKEFENNKNEIQKKIYGGVVSNIKELQALKNEDEQIERNSKELNEYANKFLTNLSLMEEKVLKIEEEVDILKENWSQIFPELKNRSDDLKTTIEKNKSDRENLFESIPDDLSMIYERLLQAKDNIAVSKVESGTCSVCRVKFPLSIEKQLVLGNDIVFCDNCGRILVII